MKRIIIFILILFNFSFIFYLTSPIPEPPPLIDSVKSDLPGDTVQFKNVSAYFTNLSRTEVINFYKANYNGPFRMVLNHPPEKAKEIILDTIQSYYLEEFIFPFKASMFINGYDWQNDVFTKPEKRIANKLIYKGVEYQSKITIKTYPTTLWQRLAAFFIIEVIFISMFFIYRRILSKPKNVTF